MKSNHVNCFILKNLMSVENNLPLDIRYPGLVLRPETVLSAIFHVHTSGVIRLNIHGHAMVWTMNALQCDQRAKSHASDHRSHNNQDNGWTTV